MMDQLKLIKPHRYIELQDNQRCFFVGDIHGDWEALRHAMDKADFEIGRDILISVGDTIDRHENSLKVATWLLQQNNVYVACGNHEKYYLDFIQKPNTGFYYKAERTGGWWVDQHDKNDLFRLAKLMQEKLYRAITVKQNGKKVGVIHAASPADWFVVENNLLSTEDWMDYIDNRAQYRRAKQADIPHINNVDAVVHGHVSAPYFSGGNQFWIDTLYATGKLTIMELDNLISH